MSRAEPVAFVAGGTVQAGGGIYLPRRADDELLEHCLAGDFTYILTSRQMGKSSLMIRAAERLVDKGAVPIVIDLTEFGAQTTAEQWYKGLLLGVEEQAMLGTPAAGWWARQADHSFAHKFTRYLREVALKERAERLVVFVDEIDTTLRLDFTDDFFAAIRFLYQQRAAEPDLRRLSFVLIGVATPGDLIKDPTRTPFNVGYRLELTDFTLDEAAPLADHLAVPAPLRRELIGWILSWTNGHPYLTLRAIRSLADSPPPAWTASLVDERIGELFLRAGADSDSNLHFVRDMLTKKAFNREAVLRTYWNIRRGRQVVDKELDQVGNWLKLSGVVRRQDGVLRVRNPIYERVFDERWARDHLRLHVNWRRRLATVAAALLVLTVVLTIPLAYYAWRQKEEALFQARQAEIQRDDAVRRRQIAEESFNKRARTLEEAQKVAEDLKTSNPAAAEAIGSLVAQGKEEVRQDRATLAAPDGGTAEAAAGISPPAAPHGRIAHQSQRQPRPRPNHHRLQCAARINRRSGACSTRIRRRMRRGTSRRSRQVQELTPVMQKAVAAELAGGRQQVRIDGRHQRARTAGGAPWSLPGWRRRIVRPQRRFQPGGRGRNVHAGKAARTLDDRQCAAAALIVAGPPRAVTRSRCDRCRRRSQRPRRGNCARAGGASCSRLRGRADNRRRLPIRSAHASQASCTTCVRRSIRWPWRRRSSSPYRSAITAWNGFMRRRRWPIPSTAGRRRQSSRARLPRRPPRWAPTIAPIAG